MAISVSTTAGTTISVSVSGSTQVSFATTTNSVSVTQPASSSISVLGKGAKGDTGATGATGSTGATGAAGSDGKSYSVSCVDGDNSDEEKIRLSDSDGGTDDVVLEAGTGLSIARSGDKITFTNTVTDTDTVLSAEQVQDIVGAMFSGNTETRIAVTYQDADGTIDLAVDDMTADTQLTSEQVEDIVGAMFSGNTETRITATYQDADGTIDLAVDAIPVDLTSDGAGTIHANNVPTLNQSTTGNAATATALATARAINGVNFDGTAAITVTAAGSTLSDTVTVAKGGTGLTTVAANSLLTGNGTSALTAEANLGFTANRLTIGGDDEITPILRLINDENTVHIAIADSADDLLTGVADGDLLIESVGDHSVVVGQNDVIQIKVTSKGAEIDNRHFQVTSNTDGDHSGDVVYIGGTTSMTTGALYHYKSDGTWELADADAASTCDGLLGIALGAASDTNGVLLRGMVTIDHDPGAVGDVLFVSTAPGDITATAPSGNGDIVRVIGYCLNASNGQIWFNPDGAFVEVSA